TAATARTTARATTTAAGTAAATATAATGAMTERAPRAGRPGWTAAITGTLALFAVLVLLLGVQMRAGRDPVLGAAAAGSSTAATARPAVVVRRIITRRVIRVVQGNAAATRAPV